MASGDKNHCPFHGKEEDSAFIIRAKSGMETKTRSRFAD